MLEKLKKVSGILAVSICAVLFALCAMLTPVLRQGANENANFFIFIAGIAVFFAALVGILFVERKIRQASLQFTIDISNNNIFIICFLLGLVVGVWNLLVYYPGTGMYDTLAILASENSYIARQHPWFYCLIIKWIVKIVRFFGGDYEVALVVCSVLQIAMMSLVFSYVLVWLKKKKINNIVWAIIAIYYIFSPILNLYKVTLFKDIPYALLLIVWVPLLYEYYISNGEYLKNKKSMCMFVCLIALSLLRNNGIYVTAFILAAMLLINFKQWKRIALLGAALVVVVAGSKVYEEKNNIIHMFKETVGIPLQQIAATVAYDGDINSSQLEFINNILPIDFIKENYNPYSADTLKWGGSPINNEFLNQNKGEFLKTWFELLWKNEKIYVKAYLQNTYSFWSFDNADRNVRYTTLYVSAWDEWINENDVKIKQIFNPDAQEKIENAMGKITKNFGAGTCFWIMIIGMFALCRKTNWRVWLIAAPAIGCWLTLMISTPVAYQWRYILYIPMTIPIIIGLLFKEDTTER